MTEHPALQLDAYVVSVLMRDLVGHDRKPSAFLVFLHLEAQASQRLSDSVAASLTMIARATGLSKASVSTALAHLRQRGLITTERETVTASPIHTLHRPWRG